MTAVASIRSRWRIQPAPRHLWLLPGLALAVMANVESEARGLGLVPVLVFGIVPHLPIVLRMDRLRLPRSVAARSVPLFNLLHEPAVPVLVLAATAAGLLPSVWLVGSLAWLGHIVVDWGLGDGLRHRDGSFRARSVLEATRTGGHR